MDRSEIGAALKKLRDEKGITIYKCGLHGVNFRAVKSIEAGSSNYSIDMLRRYLDAVGLDMYFTTPKK